MKKIFTCLAIILISVLIFLFCTNKSWEDYINNGNEIAYFGDLLFNPVITSPVNDSTNYTKPVFSWTSANKTLDYFQISRNPEFTDLVFDLKDITDKKYNLTNCLPSNQYYYARVKSHRKRAVIDRFTEWGETSKFYVVVDIPTMTSPQDQYGFDNTNLRPTFQWQALECNKTYSLQVGTDQTFAVNRASKSGLVDITYTLQSSEAFSEGDIGYWRISANDGTNNSQWSNTRIFSVGLKTPQLISPATSSTTTNRMPNFSWSNSFGATNTIEVSTDAGFSVKVIDTTTTAQNYTSSSCLLSGTYYWRVKSSRNTEVTPYSSTNQVIINLENPTLLSPINGTTLYTVRPTLQWHTSSCSDSYSLQIGTSSSFAVNIVSQSGLTSAIYSFSSRLNTSSTYYWRIISTDGVSKSTSSTNFNIPNNFWENQNPAVKPSVRRAHSILKIYNDDKFVLFGGNSLNDTWIYDMSDNIWTLQNPTKKPSIDQEEQAASVNSDDKIVLVPTKSVSETSTWIYDVSLNEWSDVSTITKPSPREGHAMSSISDDQVILFGGRNGTDFNDTWIYDVGNNTWTNKNPLHNPTATSYTSISNFKLNNKIVIIFGGYNGTVGSNATWVYDQTTDDWINKNPTIKPSSRTGHGLASLNDDDKVILFGGYDGTLNCNDTWVYDLSDNLWSEKSLLTYPSRRYGSRLACIFNNNKFLLFGGRNITDLDDTWVYEY